METRENIVEPIYKQRDLSWLDFNYRVLQEAKTSSGNPLFERLKFLAIFSSNLDEFFRVRVSKLRQIKKLDKSLRKKLIDKPNKTLKLVLAKVHEDQELFGEIFGQEILPELQENNIHILEEHQFTDTHRTFCKNYFQDNIKDCIQYSDYLSKTEITALKEGKQYLLTHFGETDEIGITSIDSDLLGRFVAVPNTNERLEILYIEDFLKQNIAELFDRDDAQKFYQIKISRDAELYFDDEFDGALVEQIQQNLSQREQGQPTRVLYDENTPKDIIKKIREQFDLSKIDTIKGGKRHNFSDFFEFPYPNTELHTYKNLPTVKNKYIQEGENYFDTLKQKDITVHFPFQSFSYLENFIVQAAKDPLVKKIKISLYRTAKQSVLTDALLKALESGKEVTVFIEAQARFDEANNIKWGKTFEEHGAHVYYSIPNIKVHSKILLIERQEETKLQYYAYIGTGNFNAKTSRIYCDHGLITASENITKDLHQVFSIIEQKQETPKLKSLLVSPFNTRTTFEALIENEMNNAKQGLKAIIKAKMNSLEDRKMIDCLYKASQAGVKIELVVRGICRLIPGIEGLSENIHITSIVDRFLEHGRIYWFYNNNAPKLYIGSADWMTRNLDKRIEVLTPITHPDNYLELRDILELQLNDNVKARKISQNQTNCMVSDHHKYLRSQYAIYNYLKQE